MTDVIKNKRHIQEIALQNLNDGVFVFDKNRKIIVFNAACERIGGISKEEIISNDYNCLDVFKCHCSDGSSLSLCPGLEIFKGKRSKISREYVIKTKDGSEKWVITNYSSIKDQKGEIEYVVGVIRDITERKMFNDEFIKIKTLSTLGQFSNELAHEIKNPLNAITIQMLLLEREINKDGLKSKKELYEVVKVVKEEINRLNKLMSDCLEFSRSGGLNRKYEDVGNIVEELLNLVNPHADLNGISIRLKLKGRCSQILVDRDKLKQALLNIIINAIEAMPGGGNIDLKVTQKDDNVKIVISDTGPGIPEEEHDNVFNLFYSTKSGGTGVGLAVTQNIVQAHGGSVRFRNLKKGTEFTITLPLY
ncbi:MAG: nitrogen regulation protein NR(II) [Candidatus Scalinduaceae bacterium]